MSKVEPSTAKKTRKAPSKAPSKAKTEAHAEVETPTPTPSTMLQATFEQIDADDKLSDAQKHTARLDARDETNATLWKEHNATMRELGKVNDFDPQSVCNLLPDGKYLGNIANFARQMAVALFARCILINEKELEGKAKKMAQNANLMARGFLMLHSGNQKVLTAISEAHREAGGESIGVKILANGDIDLRKSLIG